jgi:hypothetical protein
MKSSIDLCIYLFKVSLPRKKLKKLGISRYTGILNDNGKQVVIPETYNRLGLTIYMMKDLFVCSIANEDGTIAENEKDLWIHDSWKEITKEFEDTMLVNKPIEYTKKRISTTVNIDNQGMEVFDKHRMKYAWSEASTTPKIRNSRNRNVVKAYNLSYTGTF